MRHDPFLIDSRYHHKTIEPGERRGKKTTPEDRHGELFHAEALGIKGEVQLVTQASRADGQGVAKTHVERQQ